MSGPTTLIVNPRAGNSRAGKELPRLTRLLDSAGVEYEVFTTKAPGDAQHLANEAAGRGSAVVVAVGGDGTLQEVVNGLMAVKAENRSALGVAAAGSGADFGKTFGFPRHAGKSLKGIVGPTEPIDIGLLEGTGPDGEFSRYFANVAEAGLLGAIAARAEGMPRWLGKTRYVVALWPSLIVYKPAEIVVTVDGVEHRHHAHNALVANARYFGGGMHISPSSDPTDGVFEIQINIGPKRQAFTLVPKLYRGTHLPSDRIIQLSGSTITIDSENPIPVEADGEVLGTTPVTMTVVEKALRLVV